MKKHALIPLASLTLLASSAYGATIINFTAPISGTGTTFDGQNITGTIVFDETLIPPGPTPPPVDFFAFGVDNDTSNDDATITVSAFGQTFEHTDDLGYVQPTGSNDADLIPVVTVLPPAGGNPNQQYAFIFEVSELGPGNTTQINEPQIERFEIVLNPANAGQASYVATATITATANVPEPSSLALLLGASLLGLRRRR